MAEKVMEVNVTGVVNTRQPGGGQGASKAKCTRALDWRAPTVANRTGKWSHSGSRDPAAAAEAACEAPTKANVPAMEVTAVEGTGAEAATEGPTKK